MEHAGVGNRFPQMFHASQPGDHALDSHAEAAVGDGAVLADLQVPLEGFLGQMVLPDAREKQVVIVETPWYGRSGNDGRWASTTVAPGGYRLRTWHPALAVGAVPADQALQVEAGGAAATVKLAGLAL